MDAYFIKVTSLEDFNAKCWTWTLLHRLKLHNKHHKLYLLYYTNNFHCIIHPTYLDY